MPENTTKKHIETIKCPPTSENLKYINERLHPIIKRITVARME